jgi:LacI family transcriptional regulator
MTMNTIASQNVPTQGQAVRLIGMVYDNPSTNYINNVQTGALAACKRHNCRLIVEKIDLAAGGLRTLVSNLISISKLDGMVLPTPVCDDEDILKALKESGTPFASIAPNEPDKAPLSVQMDDYKAAYDLTKYLISLGHARIGFIKGHPKYTASERRFQGYCDALKQAGLKIDKEIIKQGYFSHQSGIVSGEALLKDPASRPTAIFASNDDMAAATIEVANKLRVKVPNEVSVAGFDDTAVASLTWPTLTTVRQPIAKMAETAVEMLLKHMDADPKTAQGAGQNKAMLDFEIVIRKSTASPGTPA